MLDCAITVYGSDGGIFLNAVREASESAFVIVSA